MVFPLRCAVRNAAIVNSVALVAALVLSFVYPARQFGERGEVLGLGLWIVLSAVGGLLSRGGPLRSFVLLQAAFFAVLLLGELFHLEWLWLLFLTLPWIAVTNHRTIKQTRVAELAEQQRLAPFRRLLQALGTGWTRYEPSNREARHHVQVYTGPGGQVFYLARTFGAIRNEYGKNLISWNVPTVKDLHRYANADSGVTEGVQRVLWVAHDMTGSTFNSRIDRGATVLFGDAATVATALRGFANMRARLEGGQPTPSDVGQQVEEDAIAELEDRLPPGWKLRPRVLLARGGDADIELTTSGGVRYVVDVKSRTDRMDLKQPKGDRAKSWRDIHTQVIGAAKQLAGTPVVWQLRAKDEDLRLVEGVWCLRSGAAVLLTALGELGQGEATEADSPHAVLGVTPGATLEQIEEAYRDLARRYHPDRVASLGEEFRLLAERRMKAINTAYQWLTAR